MKTTVCGAGSWGSALAHVLRENHEVTLWNYFSEVLTSIEKEGENKQYLPNVSLFGVHLIGDLEQAVKDAELIVVAIPTAYIRAFLTKAKPFIGSKQIIVSASKGLERGSNLLVTDIMRIEWGRGIQIAALSGPSHAEEVGQHKPTAVTVASESLEIAAKVQSVFMTSYFRVYISNDLKGVELGGAIKNVIAIAAGIIDGLDLGSNSLSALITRGLVEMEKIGKKLGGQSKTFYGLSGLGDLITTCTSKYSRNRQVGGYLADGLSWEKIQTKMHQVAEGVPTCRATWQFAKENQVEMPICEEVYRILFEGKEPKKAVLELMTREAKQE